MTRARSQTDSHPHPVLIIDDEVVMVRTCEMILRTAGIESTAGCSDSRVAVETIHKVAPSVILLDLHLPHISGFDLLREISHQAPHIPVVVFTGDSSVATAVECMRAGAFDYLVKPVAPDRLVVAVQRAADLSSLRREHDSFKRLVFANELESPEVFADIVTASPAMRSLFQYAETIARTTWPVLITGETGTGKDLLARAVHAHSGRKGQFVTVNVGGIDDQLFADTLFGHVRGAFTGASRDRSGAIATAKGGTLFLDEIGELEPSSQVKLLRLLQQGEYAALGADVVRRSDARVIVATNRDLRALMEAGRFRSDLFYRLSTHQLHMPPLRERLDDLGLLVPHLVRKAADTLGIEPPLIPRELTALLRTYAFPGNVRELEAMVSDAVSKCRGASLSVEELTTRIGKRSSNRPRSLPRAANGCQWSQLPTLEQAERLLIEEALRRANGNQTVAARILGITQSGLSRAIKRHQLSKSRGTRS